MAKFVFMVHCKPQAKLRHRRGKSGHSYLPLESVNYEAMVAMECITAMRTVGLNRKLSGPLMVTMDFYFNPSKTNAKRITEGQWHTQTPDLDNLFKSIDGLNKCLWNDDCTVCEIHATKRWTHGQEKAVITVEELDGLRAAGDVSEVRVGSAPVTHELPEPSSRPHSGDH